MELLLNADEAKQLIANITADPSTTPEEFCQQVKEASRLLHPRISAALAHFAKHGSPSGFILFRMCPEPESESESESESEIPRTPPSNKHRVGCSTAIARIQAILMSSISELIAYEAECDGQLFQDIVPTKSMAAQQTSMGSVELEIHTEQAFSNLRPDLLSLSCLRGDPSALTYILPVRTILAGLTEDEQRMLREPLWISGVDLSFKLNGQEFLEGDVRGPMPIISGSGFSEEDPHLVFDQDLMTGVTEDSQRLLEKIVAIYYKERLAHCLKPGDIIIIDNRRAVHGRSLFRPRYDGFDRFLVRCFGTLDYHKSEYARLRTSRMIGAIYS